MKSPIALWQALASTRHVDLMGQPFQDHTAIVGLRSEKDVRVLLEQLSRQSELANQPQFRS